MSSMPPTLTNVCSIDKADVLGGPHYVPAGANGGSMGSKAMVMRASGADVELEDRPVPTPGPGESSTIPRCACSGNDTGPEVIGAS